MDFYAGYFLGVFVGYFILPAVKRWVLRGWSKKE